MDCITIRFSSQNALSNKNYFIILFKCALRSKTFEIVDCCSHLIILCVQQSIQALKRAWLNEEVRLFNNGAVFVHETNTKVLDVNLPERRSKKGR